MSTTDLLERRLYSVAQVDHLLALRPGTARRWIDGYERRGKRYPPIVRVDPTGDDVVTWGEFVETRFLAEYRDRGVPIVKMRPAILQLKEQFGTKYPLATARPFAAGRELVLAVQERVGLDTALRMVEVRSGQYLLTLPAAAFLRSVDFDPPDDGIVIRLRPLPASPQVVVDPFRQFGDPVVRSVPTAVISEQFDAGDSIDLIAELYELSRDDVEAAIRYERERVKAQAPTAA